MRIEGKEVGKVYYSNIDAGECFRLDDKLCIKGDYQPDEVRNTIICIDLSNGTCYDYLPTEMVIPINAKVVEE